MCNLEWLQNRKFSQVKKDYLPKLHGTGVATIDGQERSFLVLSPEGQLISFNTPAKQFVSHMQRLVKIVQDLASHEILHADIMMISYWNLILHNGQLQLIDYQTLKKTHKVGIQTHASFISMIPLWYDWKIEYYDHKQCMTF